MKFTINEYTLYNLYNNLINEFFKIIIENSKFMIILYVNKVNCITKIILHFRQVKFLEYKERKNKTINHFNLNCLCKIE